MMFSDTNVKNIKQHILSLFKVFLICSITTILSLTLSHLGIVKENLLMIFLVGVLLSTIVIQGYIYGFLTAFLSVFLFNYFFTKPLHTFLIGNQQDILLILFFFLAALICGLMSSDSRNQMLRAQENEQTSQFLYEMTESFLKITGVENIVQNALNYIYEKIGYSCMVILDSEKFANHDHTFSTPDCPDGLNAESGCSFPIESRTHRMGVIIFEKNLPKDSNTEKIIHSIIHQMALVLDREYIYLERERMKLQIESEHLKSTLLRSISHDIRTPLTGIIGASNVLIEQNATLEKADALKLASNINDEASWLIMTVQNILNMTRITDGRLTVSADYESVDDLLHQTIERLPHNYPLHRLTTEMPEEIYLVYVDGNLFVQVLLNLLDNAFKHSGNDSSIILSAFPKGEQMIFEVRDNGLGIPPSILEHIFEGFTTLPTHAADKGRGVGLGLSICKAIIQAHGGEIYAKNLPTGGACFTISLPWEQDETEL